MATAWPRRVALVEQPLLASAQALADAASSTSVPVMPLARRRRDVPAAMAVHRQVSPLDEVLRCSREKGQVCQEVADWSSSRLAQEYFAGGL